MKKLPKNKEKNKEEDSLFIKGLRKIAELNLKSDDGMMVRWWCEKYKLPPNHPLLLERYEEDLMIEALQDEHIRKQEEDQDQKEEQQNKDNSWEQDLPEDHDNKIKRKLAAMKNAPKNTLEKWQKKAKLIEGEEIFNDIEDLEIDEEF